MPLSTYELRTSIAVSDIQRMETLKSEDDPAEVQEQPREDPSGGGIVLDEQQDRTGRGHRGVS